VAGVDIYIHNIILVLLLQNARWPLRSSRNLPISKGWVIMTRNSIRFWDYWNDDSPQVEIPKTYSRQTNDPLIPKAPHWRGPFKFDEDLVLYYVPMTVMMVSIRNRNAHPRQNMKTSEFVWFSNARPINSVQIKIHCRRVNYSTFRLKNRT